MISFDNVRKILSISIVFVVLATAIYAEGGSFTAESFIPERFSDLEWMVDGSFSLTGDDRNTDLNSSPFSRYTSELTYQENDRASIDIGSQLRRRYITIPKFYDLSVTVDGTYNHYDRYSDRYSDYSGARGTTYLYDRKAHSYNGSVSSSLDAGAYLKDDFFVSVITRGRYRYNETPDSESNNTQLATYLDLDPVREFYSERYLESTYDYRSADLGLEIMPGWGRVYAGDFAVTAMYIIEELDNRNLISRQPSNEQMLSLTDTVYYYRLKHAVDDRLHRVQALTKILDYLHSEGVIDDPGPHGHILVADVWDYFPGGGRSLNSNREFGYRIRLGAGIDYMRSSEHRTTIEKGFNLDTEYSSDDPSNIDTLNLRRTSSHRYDYQQRTRRESYLSALCEYHKPVNLRWQLGFLLRGWYFLDSYENFRSSMVQRSDDGTDDYEYASRVDIDDYYRFSLRTEASYTLDSRTEASLDIGTTYEHRGRNRRILSDGILTENDNQTTENWDYDIVGRLTYRISVPTSLRLTVSYRDYESDLHIDNDYSMTGDQSSYGVSLRISHYLM